MKPVDELFLTNPHSVLAVLEARPGDVLRMETGGGKLETAQPAWKKVLQHPEFSAKIFQVNAPGGGNRGGAHRHSGWGCWVRPRMPASLAEFLSPRKTDHTPYRLLVALDQVQDPQNVGAIFRSAAFFGVEGVLLLEDRQAPLTATVYDVAAGGVDAVPFCLETNLTRALEQAKKADFWILGASEHARDSLATIKADRDWLLVFGNEEKGIRRLIQETSDVLVKIPSRGKVTSLNISAAATCFLSRLRI